MTKELIPIEFLTSNSNNMKASATTGAFYYTFFSRDHQYLYKTIRMKIK
jgi:hypothetical protein